MLPDEDTRENPNSWRPADRPLRRVIRAVTAPPVAGGVVLLSAIVIAVLLVVMRPQGTEAVNESAREQPTAFTEIVEAQPEPVLVHVAGEVQKPGVVELEAGSRVEAAIVAAGGVTEGAVLEGINLARVLFDGEHIVIPNAQTQSFQDAPGVISTDGKIHLNTADAAALETLPGIGPALATRIIDWRENNSGFSSIDDLLQISGIGLKIFEQLRDQVSAP